jgi:PAS domain S-box-containing protein
MKKLTAAVIVFLTIFTCASAVADQPQELSSDFFHLFDRHGAIILIIDWETGDILYANGAAAEFYGYSETQLASMNVASIARLPVEEINMRFHQASAAQKNLCLFDHYLATGQLRTVEVFFYPASYAGRSARFSIVHDVTEKLQRERERRTMTIAVLAGSGVAILCLGAFVVLLLRGRKKLENTNTLRKIFFDASDALIYLKDEQLRYVFANQAMAAALGVPVDRLAGKDDLSLPEDAAAHSRRQAELAVLESAAPAAEETEWRGRLYHAKRFPLKMPNGQLGVGAHITDITERREHEKKQEKLLLRHKILTDVILRGFESRHAQLDYVLHEALGLTESKYVYIYLYDEKTQELTLNSWTAGVMETCAVAKKYTLYQLDNTGLWARSCGREGLSWSTTLKRPIP